MTEKKPTEEHETKQKASRKAGKILRQLDDEQLENVAGGSCRTCGLIMQPGGLPTLEV
jgi:hypothetical protein